MAFTQLDICYDYEVFKDHTAQLKWLLSILGSKFYVRRPAGNVNIFKSVFQLVYNAYTVKKKNSG